MYDVVEFRDFKLVIEEQAGKTTVRIYTKLRNKITTFAVVKDKKYGIFVVKEKYL